VVTGTAEQSRAFGPFEVSWLPEAGAQPHVLVRIHVVGQLLWEMDMPVTSAASPFDVGINAYRATGTIGASWLDPEALTGLLLGQNVVFSAPDQQMTFTGTLGVWIITA
jgi:hypothetical protein